MTNARKPTVVAAAMLLAGLIACPAADTLQWDMAHDRVDATIQTWTVPQLLQHVATATGWEIYLDPEITNRIPTKFTGKEMGDALRRLLGDYSYALVPETNSAAKFFVFRNSRDQATRAIQPLVNASKSSTNRIGNELVVTLKPGEKIEDLAKRIGAKIVGRSDAQNTYRLRFDDDQSADTARAALQKDSAVEGVDNNFYVARPETSQALGTPGAALALTPKASPEGKYTVVGLVDSAVQPKDGDFANFLLPGAATSDAASGSGPTHGTSMAETILRALAANTEDKTTTVRLLPVNVFSDGAEQTSTYDIAVGIYKAVNGGAMIVNLSLGGDGDSSFLHNTIISAHDQGVVLIAAPGNTPVTTPTYPAAYSEVLAITASDRSGNIASYANRGNFVDGIAPGGNIITFKGQQYYVMGTSTSTAFASGVAAAIAEATKQTGGSIEAAVRKALAPKTPAH